MSMARRLYLVAGLVAVLALAFSAVSITSRFASAQGTPHTPNSQACAGQDEADDAAESQTGAAEADNDSIENECGAQDEADDNEAADADEADDAAEAQTGAAEADDDDIEDEHGPQDQADGNEPAEADAGGAPGSTVR